MGKNCVSQVFVVHIAVLLLLSGCTEKPVQPSDSVHVVINEFMTSNTTGDVTDEYGEADDWVELYNNGQDSTSLANLCLSDDSIDVCKYIFPDTTIPPGGYTVIWADDQPQQGALHAPFKLSAHRGEEIVLCSSNGSIIDRIQFYPHNANPQARIPDVSYGRSPDGSENWTRQKEATPGGVNAGK